MPTTQYAELLSEIEPKLPQDETEYKRLLAHAEGLIDLGENISDAHSELLKLIAVLLEKYEDEHFQLKVAKPNEVLQELMGAHGLKQADLRHIFRSKGLASDVINGKRGISKKLAKELASFFHVSPELFI